MKKKIILCAFALLMVVPGCREKSTKPKKQRRVKVQSLDPYSYDPYYSPCDYDDPYYDPYDPYCAYDPYYSPCDSEDPYYDPYDPYCIERPGR